MATTIQIDEKLKSKLDSLKIHHRETYNDVIELLLEDTKELNEKTKREIAKARKEIKKGQVISHEELKKRFGL